MEYKDYYKLLGIDRKASADEIKHAYRRLARKFHPDVSKEPNAEEQFKNIQEAYEVLKDPEKRAAYDQLGSNWKTGQEFRPPPGWQGGGGGTRFYTSGDAFSEAEMEGFSDFFSFLFGGGEGRGRARAHQPFQQRGQDQHAKILISLEDAYHGATRTLQLQMPEVDARGQIHHQLRTLKVNIPAGAAKGQQLRLAKQGIPGVGGGPPGDLFLELDIEPHSLFSLQGQDVYLTLPVTPWEAALGASIKVPTLGGPVDVKLAPGSQGGQKLRLKGRGMKSAHHVGDQYAILQVMIPPAKTEEEKQIYSKMAQVMPFNPRQTWPI